MPQWINKAYELWDAFVFAYGWHCVAFLLGCLVTQAGWMIREARILRLAAQQEQQEEDDL